MSKPVSFYPEIAKELDSIEAAIFYQQIFFWSDKGGRSDGFIYRTKEEIEKETGLNRYQQDKARHLLVNKKWLETKLIKANGVPTIHYKPMISYSLELRDWISSPSTNGLVDHTLKPRLMEKSKAASTLSDSITVITPVITPNTNMGGGGKVVSVFQDLIDFFNSSFEGSYKLTNGRKIKLQARLKVFSVDEIKTAISNLSKSDWHRGNNEKGWKADPDFLFRNDEQIDRWIQKAPVENNAIFEPLTDEQVWEMAGRVNVSMKNLRMKEAEILEMARTGAIKKYPYAKNTLETLERWIIMARDAGRIPTMNEMDIIDHDYMNPKEIAKRKAFIEEQKGKYV